MGYSPELWAIITLGAVVIVSAITDLRSGKIPNSVTYPAIAVGLIVQTYLHGSDGLAGALAGLAVGFLPMLVFWLAGGIGGGDAKLMGAIGALSNARFAVSAMFCAFGVVLVMALVVMIRRRIVVATLRRIGRTLVLAVVPGVRAPGPSTETSPRLPFGLAVCIGTGLALADSLLFGPVAARLLGI